MRRRFPQVRPDRKFRARIVELQEKFDDENQLLLILRDANLMPDLIEQMLDEVSAETKATREGIRKKRGSPR